jgi:hypothetical protein
MRECQLMTLRCQGARFGTVLHQELLFKPQLFGARGSVSGLAHSFGRCDQDKSEKLETWPYFHNIDAFTFREKR